MKEFAKNRTLIQILRKFIEPDREKRKIKGMHVYIDVSILQTDRQTYRQKEDQQYTVFETLETFSVRPYVSCDSEIKTWMKGGGA